MGSELEKLAARVEALTGPDREVDAAIMRLFTNSVESDDGDFWHGPHGTVLKRVPAFTASIDAAMTLVPDCAEFGIRRLAGEGWRCWYVADFELGKMKMEQGSHANGAIALVLCVIRARPIIEGTGNG